MEEKKKRSEEEEIIKNIRNLFKLKKEIKGIKYIILKYIKNLFEHEEEEENYFKPVRVNNFWSNNYIEYKSNSDISKRLLVEEYLNKIRPCLKDIINDIKKSDIWEIQLTIANDFISSLDYDEEHVMHSKSNNIEIMINDDTVEIIE